MARVRGRWSPMTRCIWERETKACTAPERPNPKISGQSVSQNMKNAMRRLSAMGPRICIPWLPLCDALDGIDQFLHLGLVALADRGRHTAFDMVLEQQQPDLVDGGLDGVDLGQDVDAVGLLIDHPRDAADLAFDATQSGQERVAILRITWFHTCHHTPGGYISRRGRDGTPAIPVPRHRRTRRAAVRRRRPVTAGTGNSPARRGSSSLAARPADRPARSRRRS